MVRNFVGRNKLVRKILISGLSWSERVDPRISKLRILHAKNVPLQHLQHSTRHLQHLQHDATLTCNTIHALLRKRAWLFNSQCNTALRRTLLVLDRDEQLILDLTGHVRPKTPLRSRRGTGIWFIKYVLHLIPAPLRIYHQSFGVFRKMPKLCWSEFILVRSSVVRNSGVRCFTV